MKKASVNSVKIPYFRAQMFRLKRPAYGLYTQDGTGKMGCMKLCGSFHIAPKTGQGGNLLSFIVVALVLCSYRGASSSQYEYTINTKVIRSSVNS